MLLYVREHPGALPMDLAAAQVLRDLAVGPVALLTAPGDPPDGLLEQGVDVVYRTDLGAPVLTTENVRRIG